MRCGQQSFFIRLDAVMYEFSRLLFQSTRSSKTTTISVNLSCIFLNVPETLARASQSVASDPNSTLPPKKKKPLSEQYKFN